MTSRNLLVRFLLPAMALWLGLGAAPAHAAPPPSLTIEVIGKGSVAGTGIACGVGRLTCHATYGSDPAAVTLTATAAAGWTFDHWEDDGSGCATATTCPQSVTGAQTVTAVFTTPSAVGSSTFGVSLTQHSATANGAVTNASVNYPIDCAQGVVTATQCSVSVVVGSTITVNEQPDPGYFFSRWGGDCSGATSSCSAYMSGNKFVSADFVSSSATSTLEVSVNGPGSVSGPGVSCSAGSTCDIQEPLTSSVALTATPQDGYAFIGWTGDCSGTQTTCTVQMNADRSVTAKFDQIVPILVTVNGKGTVAGAGTTCGPGPQTCSGNATPNTTIQLVATPPAGASVSWSGCSSSAGAICNLAVVESALSVTATFSAGTQSISNYTLAVGVTGDGYVTGSAGSAAIYCTASGGGGCVATVQQNATVSLTAVTASGHTADFNGWGGDCSSLSASCTFSMTGAKSVSAGFGGPSTTYQLTGHVAGAGTGAISGAGLTCSSLAPSCSSPEAADARLTMVAVPDPGSTFDHWSGACTGSAPECTVAMTAAQSVTATFAAVTPEQPTLLVTVVGAGKVATTGGTCTATVKKAGSCPQVYASGTLVKLTAAPAPGFYFAGWKDACTGKKTTCSVTVAASATVTATFARLPLVAGHKPVVTRTSAGFRVTLFYTARESGTLRVTATRAGAKPISLALHTAARAGRVVIAVKHRGRYRVTLTLTSKSGKHSIRWTVVV